MRLHLCDRLRHVVSPQASGQPQRHGLRQGPERITHPPAQGPVVCAAGATQLFGGCIGPTGIEQHSVDKRRHGQGLVDGALVHHVNHLHQFSLGAQQAK
jgi:hypothetical protein